MCKTGQSESEVIIVEIEDVRVNFQTEPVFIEEENALLSETYRQSINIAEESVTIETEDFHVKFQTKPYDKEFWQRISIYQLIYSLSGLVLGLACMILGVVLLLHGITGSTNWTAKFIGGESNISDAAPGVVLFVVGLFVVWVTRFKVKMKK